MFAKWRPFRLFLIVTTADYHMEAQTNCSPFCWHFQWWHFHDDVIKWKNFPRYWPFKGHRWTPLTKTSDAGLWCLICVWMNGSVNNREAGDLRRHRAHYDVTVMTTIDLDRYEAFQRNAIVWIAGLAHKNTITLQWQWARWRLKSPASRIIGSTVLEQIKENIKTPCHWPLWGNPPLTGGIPSQRASNAENVPIWWRHHGKLQVTPKQVSLPKKKTSKTY